MVKIFYTCALIFALAACGGGNSPPDSAQNMQLAQNNSVPAKQLFGAAKQGSQQRAEPIGSYAKGCIAGGQALPDSGPTWQAMRLSRNRNWGHPRIIDYIQDLSRKVAKIPGWNGLYVGDISQPRGGPMLTGHASHQIGLDVDIWMLPPKNLNLSQKERENISSISMRRASGAFTNNAWTQGHRDVLKLAASDDRVARIFVFPGAKVDMCRNETGDRSYLRKIRPWWGHHYHFHVRLACPRGAKDCENQAPPPPGDGCDEAEGWVDRILNPPPPDPNAKPRPPRQELRMRDLPLACTEVLASN